MSNLIFQVDGSESGDSSPRRLLRDRAVVSAMDDFSRNNLYAARSKILQYVGNKDDANNTLNPSDCDPDVQLTFANHAAEKGANYRSVRANYPLPTNRRTYFEFSVIKATQNDDWSVCFGLSSKSMSLNSLVGMKPHTIGLYSNGNVVCNNKWTQLRLGSRIKEGSVVGICVEMLHYRTGTNHCNNVGLVSYYLDGEPITNPKTSGKGPSNMVSPSLRSSVTSPQFGSSYAESDLAMGIESYEETLRSDLMSDDVDFHQETQKSTNCCDCMICSKESQLAAQAQSAATAQQTTKRGRQIPRVKVESRDNNKTSTPNAPAMLSPTGDAIIDHRSFVDDNFCDRFSPANVPLKPAFIPRVMIESDSSDDSASPDSDPLSPVTHTTRMPLGATRIQGIASSAGMATRCSIDDLHLPKITREEVLAKLDDPYVFVVRFAPHRNIYPTISFYTVLSHLTNNDLVYGDCVQSLGTVYGMDKRLVTATPQQNMRRISSPDDDDDDDGPFAMSGARHIGITIGRGQRQSGTTPSVPVSTDKNRNGNVMENLKLGMSLSVAMQMGNTGFGGMRSKPFSMMASRNSRFMMNTNNNCVNSADEDEMNFSP